MSKKRIKKIQDYDSMYSTLFHYVRFSVKQSYRSILQVGEENIPKDGAIIFAPNHTNTLMDALVVLTYNCQPKVFVARADIFRNRKLAQIFTFLKIMPIMRQRDGISAVKKNQETIDKAVDVLKDRIPFCIFPEGTHQAKYSSLPLSKGIFRIAYQAHDLMPDVPLYIVPVGIKYGDFFRFRSTIRMEFGKPINVGEFIAKNAHMTPQEQTNSLKDLLTERLHSTIFHIPNDEDYAATYEVCNAVEPFEMENISHSGKHILEVQHEANKQALKRIEALKESNPEKAQKLLELGKEASKLRKKKGIDYLALYASGIGTCQSGGTALSIHLHETEGSCFQKLGTICDESSGMAFVCADLCYHSILFVPLAIRTFGNPSYHSGSIRGA